MSWPWKSIIQMVLCFETYEAVFFISGPFLLSFCGEMKIEGASFPSKFSVSFALNSPSRNPRKVLFSLTEELRV